MGPINSDKLEDTDCVKPKKGFWFETGKSGIFMLSGGDDTQELIDLRILSDTNQFDLGESVCTQRMEK